MPVTPPAHSKTGGYRRHWAEKGVAWVPRLLFIQAETRM